MIQNTPSALRYLARIVLEDARPADAAALQRLIFQLFIKRGELNGGAPLRDHSGTRPPVHR
jgi:hypothetical protein